MNRRIKRAHALIGATALCCLLVVPIAVAGSAGGSGGPEATASSVQKQVKKLKKRVRKLEQQVEGLAKQPGPQGQPGSPGQDATKLFAYIRDDGAAVTANVQYGSGVTAVSDPVTGGIGYVVTFNRSLVNCVVHAAPGFGDPRAGGNAFPMSVPLVNVGGSGLDDQVSVGFRDVGTGSLVDTSFLITAFC